MTGFFPLFVVTNFSDLHLICYMLECKKICIFACIVNVNVCVQTCLFERPPHVVYEHNVLNAKAH